MYNQYIDRIKQVYPDLWIDDVEPNKIGQNNDVLMINKSLVFRFPKYLKGITNLKDETELVNKIKDRVTITIPNPIYQSFEILEAGKVFTGYKKIQGSPLWREELSNIKDVNLFKKLASQLATFLFEVHSIPLHEINPIFKHQKQKGIRTEVEELFENIQNRLYSFMRKDAKENITHMFEVFLNNPNNLEMNLTLIHGDFGASNILWDSFYGEISGIIDFGGSGIGDPAYDFSGLLSSYGETFFQLCIEQYPNGNEISDRVSFYKKTFALQEALHGLENKDNHAFENGIKEYR
ncbi:phosphotransferase family protein [Chengkuizengella axinellae]|uniref:Aminoglycoside phosphotransferase family protein n=1 Tax=Chengkuizengella axinellae TaxID=3064388 RepID=A0ABT9J4I8_9BACL|nr:aminoglycoside phosphotransferase family protein [Chengkuizengella sp. 2205SS18-9]MDP5276516.1 aminoglycoside phosphotransferase family protein [Chengkuizengella sp. 2205SS18-9]